MDPQVPAALLIVAIAALALLWRLAKTVGLFTARAPRASACAGCAYSKGCTKRSP